MFSVLKKLFGSRSGKDDVNAVSDAAVPNDAVAEVSAIVSDEGVQPQRDDDALEMSSNACVSRMTEALHVAVDGEHAPVLDKDVQTNVEHLINAGTIGAKELVDLVRAAFSNHVLSLVVKGQLKPPVDLESLASCIISQPKAMSALDAAREATKPVVASAVLSSLSADGTLDRGMVCEVLSAGFEMLACSNADKSFSDRLGCWTSVFVSSISFSDRVPDSLIAFALQSSHESKAVTSRITKINHGVRSWDWVSTEDFDRANDFCSTVLKAIIEANSEDYVALIALGNVHLNASRFSEVRNCFRKAAAIQVNLGCSHKDLCDAKLAIVRTYDSQVKHMKKSRLYEREDIRIVIKEARDAYAGLIESAKAHGVDGDSYMQHYVRFLKNNSLFRDAETVVQQMRLGWRRSLEEGMLYSSMNARRPADVARFKDFSRATACYVDAWHMLMESEASSEAKAKVSVLYPLASALLSSGNTQSAFEVARFGLSIMPSEKSFMRIIEKTGHDSFSCTRGGAKMPRLLECA